MSQTTSKRRSLPGDAAWWMFLTAEFLTLGIFFVAYAFSRAGNVEAFQASQAELHPQLAFANTLILITSGFFAARGVLAMQAGKAFLEAHSMVGMLAIPSSYKRTPSLTHGTK